MVIFDLFAGLNSLVPGVRCKGAFNEHTIIEYNALVWLDPRPKPTYVDVEIAALAAMRIGIRNEINTKTNGMIVTGMIYNSVPVYADLEFQFNLSQLFINKDMITYPYQMKLSDDEDGCGRYIMVQDSNEMATIYFTVFNHVAVHLESGRLLKDTLKTMNRTALEEFRDLR